ncbi:MAG: response regulator [Bradymonadales bacterium]
MKKILVVDDSKTIRTLCEWLFKGLENELLTADSIAQARSSIAEHRPSVIVLDYTMPDGDAYEFCKELKAGPQTSSTPILFLGGNYAKVDEAKARACGANDVLLKPFKSGDFLSKIDHLASLAPAATGLDAGFEVEVSDADAMGSPTMPALTKPASRNIADTQSQPARRFNFPISGLSQAAASPESHKTPPKPLPAAVRSTERETPQTPLPSVSPVAAATTVSIDPEVLRAEIQAAVKEILPSVVRGVLKKLIVTEVTPQIQNWVDARVEALIKKMLR